MHKTECNEEKKRFCLNLKKSGDLQWLEIITYIILLYFVNFIWTKKKNPKQFYISLKICFITECYILQNKFTFNQRIIKFSQNKQKKKVHTSFIFNKNQKYLLKINVHSQMSPFKTPMKAKHNIRVSWCL